MANDFEQTYADRRPLLRKAKKALAKLLNGAAASIQDRRLVRAEVRQVRIKSLTSLQEKAAANGWSATRAFAEASDLVGGRVVCNNVEDVYRFCELLKAALNFRGHFEIQDHIKVPKNGYRALHINIHLPVSRSLFDEENVAVEVQIRTRLQDAWAELVHADIYKNQDLPDDLKVLAEHLAITLEATDKIASDIRARVTRRAAVAKDLDPAKVSADGLAYVFAEVFGTAPPDYVAREAVDLAKSSGLTTLTPLRETLARVEFRERLDVLYRKHLRLPADTSEVFLACIVATAKGERKGLSWLGRRARREADEMQAIYEREALSGLPETIEELLEDPTAYIDDHVAQVLGAADACAVCSEIVIRPDSVAEMLVRHYELEGDAADKAHQRIEEAVRVSSLETGGWDTTSLCSYHADRWDKD